MCGWLRYCDRPGWMPAQWAAMTQLIQAAFGSVWLKLAVWCWHYWRKGQTWLWNVTLNHIWHQTRSCWSYLCPKWSISFYKSQSALCPWKSWWATYWWRHNTSYRFSAFWLRSKCSICSYQLNIWYGGHVPPSRLNWFLQGDRVQELAPALSRVGLVLQYHQERPTDPH